MSTEDQSRATPSLDVDTVMLLADSMAAWKEIACSNPTPGSVECYKTARASLLEYASSALMSNAAPEVDRSAVRREALEEAAKICRMNHRHTLSRAIRALADPLQGKETP